MSTVAAAPTAPATANPCAPHPTAEQISLALLGFGRVGAAVAEIAARFGQRQPAFRTAGALVRDVSRHRDTRAASLVPLTSSRHGIFQVRPDVVVEVLGGLEPARSLVLESFQRGIPVVTANKSLLAVHGDELFAAASEAGVALRYEAAVVAGVPFLGTFARRPLASAITFIAGVLNGTSNFILSRMAADRIAYRDALSEATANGFAEPDPAKDVIGRDATEKLCVLLRQFGKWSVHPCDVETGGIEGVTSDDLQQAAAAGGAVKPVVFARWDGDDLTAFSGPAFVRRTSPLATLDGVTNGLLLGGGPAGDLFYSGPGAGPTVTAVTILDDVSEVISERGRRRPLSCEPAYRSALPTDPQTGWFVRLNAPALPHVIDVADLLASHSVWVERTSETVSRSGEQARWLWTHPSSKRRLDHALRSLSGACGCRFTRLRVLEV
jgi:homoserine dehydrogenase